MTGLILIGQAIVIIWLLILLGKTTGDLKRRIDRASRHLEATDKPEEPKPICGCGHHSCFHDDDSCSKGETLSWRNPDGNWEKRVEGCGCKRYTGPEPLPKVIP